MCTVTYIPAHDKFFLTSNRDEKHRRSAALPPQEYEFASGKIYFPKDGDAGGSWLAVHENGNVIVLLNGGFEKHHPRPPYRKSRGIILLDLIQNSYPSEYFRSINLENIEPFTLVLFDHQQLCECRWDGERKHSKLLDNHQPRIWSSVTLYDEQTIEKRTEWFKNWLAEQTRISQDDILHFHRFAGDGDRHNDLLMNRGGQVFTVSITGIEIEKSGATIKYLDLIANKRHILPVTFEKAPVTHS